VRLLFVHIVIYIYICYLYILLYLWTEDSCIYIYKSQCPVYVAEGRQLCVKPCTNIHKHIWTYIKLQIELHTHSFWLLYLNTSRYLYEYIHIYLYVCEQIRKSSVCMRGVAVGRGQERQTACQHRFGYLYKYIYIHTYMERWGAGVETHFQEISWNLRPVVNGT